MLIKDTKKPYPRIPRFKDESYSQHKHGYAHKGKDCFCLEAFGNARTSLSPKDGSNTSRNSNAKDDMILY